MAELTERERAMLDLEGRVWRYGAIKERAILEQLGLKSVEYYQQLLVLIDRREAWEYAPMTVGRLQRARDVRRKARRHRGRTPAF